MALNAFDEDNEIFANLSAPVRQAFAKMVNQAMTVVRDLIPAVAKCVTCDVPMQLDYWPEMDMHDDQHPVLNGVEIELSPSTGEVVGGAEDGETIYQGFTADITKIAALLEATDKRAEIIFDTDPVLAPAVNIVGDYNGHAVTVTLCSMPLIDEDDEDDGPAFVIRPGGEIEYR